jgi:hypothetical protein
LDTVAYRWPCLAYFGSGKAPSQDFCVHTYSRFLSKLNSGVLGFSKIAKEREAQTTLGPSFVLASSLDILPLSTPHCIGNKYSFFFSQVNTVLLYDIPWHVINSCLCHCRVYFESSAKAGTWLGLAWFELEARHMKSHLERGRNA